MKKNDEQKTKEINGEEIQTGRAFGSSGTEIYSGYLDEEYLKELTNSDRAKIFDRMRRGDAIVRMILLALKLPIKSANWHFNVTDDTKEYAQEQKEFFEHVFFKELDQSFTKWIGEVLTFFDYGYSLFELVHQIKVDSEIGPHIGIKKIGYRSPKTIERWMLNDNNELDYVEQIIDGDTAQDVYNINKIPAKFLVHFCPEQEGDDFEGMATLRSCYGAWKRKNLFLKLLAAGIEKHSIPTPVGEVPSGQENSEERKLLEQILQRYSSNQSNYIIHPEGYKIDLLNTSFDAQKIRDAIEKENQEMVNSILAGFLLLGQGSGGGSFALSENLSSFFGITLKGAADHIVEVVNEKILKPLVKLNFPNQNLVVTLESDALINDANKDYADTIMALISSGAIRSDDKLEEFIREKYALPVKDEESEREPEPQGGIGLNFSEPRYRKRAERMQDIQEQSQKKIRDTFKKHLSKNFDELVEKLVKKAQEKGQRKYQGIRGLMRGPSSEYINEVQELIAEEVTKGVNAFPEFSEQLKFSEFKKLPTQIREKLRNRARIQIESQFEEIEKQLTLQYMNSIDSTDSINQIAKDLTDTKERVLSPGLLEVGAAALANDTITSAVLDTLEDQVESWTFIAEIDEATSEICRSLNMRTFEAGDPDIKRFRPPLHFNCRSVLVPNKKEWKGNPPIDQGPLALSKKALESIKFSCCN